MSEPKRIQLSRAKGWRLPDGAVNVARPTKWGNPVSISEVGGRADVAVDMYRAFLDGAPGYIRRAPTQAEIVSELAGKDLACWCKLGDPCHADVLLRRANGDHPIRPASQIAALNSGGSENG